MREQKSGKNRQHNFTWFLAKLMRFPLTAFANGLDMFVKTFHEMQRVADDGIELFITDGEPEKAENLENRTLLPVDDSNAAIEKSQNESSGSSPTGQNVFGKPIDNTDDDSNTPVNDRDLRDDLLKLVRYKVLFVKRDYEHAFPEQEGLIAENLDSATFTLWKVAEFIQHLGKDLTEVPEKWLTRNYPPSKYREGSILKGLPNEDKNICACFIKSSNDTRARNSNSKNNRSKFWSKSATTSNWSPNQT